jgi:multiple sugar transport system permease protein
MRSLTMDQKANRAGWLFTLPVTLGFILFTIGPMIVSLYYSFTNYNGISSPQFIGFSNYAALFNGDDVFFKKAVIATAKYTLIGTPVYLIFSLIIALLINSAYKARGFFRLAAFIPSIVPTIATCLVWKWLCDPSLGVINNTLKNIGIYTQMKWFYSTQTSITTMIIMWMWGCGSTMIVLLAGLQDVPVELYEAMDVDGGRFFQKLFYITIPMISPSLLFSLMVGFVTAVQCFVPAYSITNGGPSSSTMFYIFYMYREAFSYGNMGGACAIAWVIFFFLLVLTQVISKLTAPYVYYGGG